MIIQKGTVKAIFHEQGLQIAPEVLPAIDRQVTQIIERFAIRKATAGLKRLKVDDIMLINGPQMPQNERSGPEVGKGTENAISSNILQDNPSKIPGPCSRCVGIHDRVMRIARDLEVQINEGAISVYKEKLEKFSG